MTANVPELTVIWWRDIPAQVTATDGARTARVELSGRFLHAVDDAAMTAGLVESGAYLEEWRRESRPCGADLERETAAEADRLEQAHPADVLAELVQAGGVARSADP
jgi:cvfA/B/C family virulence factor